MKAERVSDILIIGGGAAGLTAAIAAARHGARPLVVERMSRVGKKLLSTGNGRCNLSNARQKPEAWHGAEPAFVQKVLEGFGLKETQHFFEGLGILLKEEEDGKIFPLCEQASSVLDALREECARLGVKIIENQRIHHIEKGKNGFLCRSTEGHTCHAERVILATGGKAAPNLGSNGGGYKIAEQLGHRCTPLFPALVQICLEARWLKRLKGLKVDGRVSLLVEDEEKRVEEGEILFTEYGLSGPPILQISRLVAAQEEQKREAVLDFFPDWCQEELEKHLEQREQNFPWKSPERRLMGLLHKRLIPVLLEEAAIANYRQEGRPLSEEEQKRLAGFLKNWRLPCRGVQSWMNAQVTAGGLDCRDFSPETLESRLCPGFYAAGEVLDVDGDCGGYNLQWAWSTGFLAGRAAAASK